MIGAILAVFGLTAFTIFLAELSDILQAHRNGADKSLLQRLEELGEVLNADDDGTVTQEEYILHNLRKMGKVDDDTLGLLRDQFKALDADGSGELDQNDIRLLTHACGKLERGRASQQEGRTLAPTLAPEGGSTLNVEAVPNGTGDRAKGDSSARPTTKLFSPSSSWAASPIRPMPSLAQVCANST